jgi:hypothetical protein
MQKLKSILQTGLLYALAILLVAGQPGVVRAEETAPPPSNSTYNEQTGHWETDKWYWDPATGSYKQRPVSSPAPAPAETTGQAPVQTQDPTTTSTPTQDLAPVTQETNSAHEGPDSDSAIHSTTSNSADASINTTNVINNKLRSSATTGNAGVSSNTTAGGATSGDAYAEATVVNTLHSSVQGDNAGIAHFTADINGNVNGDITLYPAIANATSTVTNDNKVGINNNNKINNDLTLTATSGNTDVTGNTTAGSATSGNADTVLNLVNLINSVIAANQSFIGTINIHGNLNGDILISPDFIPQLLADNHQETDSVTNNLSANLVNNDTIVNNIALAANSGNATIADNTTAGNATTGTGQTNLTVLNLTGHEVVAKDSVLVFVNVLGKWVGVIANAPAGATSALLGNGVSSNIVNNSELNATTNNQITNNIDLASLTGDASVTRNTRAGNAITGNATASANIANISTSTIDLSHWFGILFINVFGEWYGSFGVDTENGNVVPLSGMAVPHSGSQASSLRMGFVPHSSSGSQSAFGGVGGAGLGEEDMDDPVAEAVATLAAARGAGGSHGHMSTTAASQQLPTVKSFNPLGLAIVAIGTLGFTLTLATGALRRRFARVA